MDASANTTEVIVSPSARYYRKNRDVILAREREKKRWLDYYERNREAVRERQRLAYIRRKEAAQATLPTPANAPV